MAIFSEIKGQTRHINIICFEAKDMEPLMRLLEQDCFILCEIYIYDTEVLPEKVIGSLVCSMRNLKIKIHVQKTALLDYLVRLGIHAVLLQPDTNNIDGGRILSVALTKVVGIIEWKDAKSLLESIYKNYGYDFSNYQQDSILRRISRYIFKEKYITLGELMQSVKENKESVSGLLSGLTVSTTEFFRDGKVYSAIRESILPYLNSYPSIKIWCAGCSTGEEAYSVAILLEEVGMLDKALIYATDLSFNSIQQANNGLYSKGDIQKGSKNYLTAGGKDSFEKCFSMCNSFGEIKGRYKKHVLFFQHSLVESGVINEFQLILCRNVLMYFNHELRCKIMNLFYESMDRSGFLILGKSEGIHISGKDKGFIVTDVNNKIYKRKS